jgi:hypothetical protein
MKFIWSGQFSQELEVASLKEAKEFVESYCAMLEEEDEFKLLNVKIVEKEE